MAEIDKELAEELRLIRKSREAAAVGDTGKIPLPAGFEEFGKKLGVSAEKFNPLSKGIGAVSDGFNQLKGVLETSVTTFRSISNVGASFSNDIVGMSVAAVGARVSIREFGDIIRENGKLVSSLGGNITQSVEQFSKLSKEMFDQHSQTTNQLETLGYTTKDLNEVLALSTFARRTTDLRDKESRAAAIKAATDLAYEMDAMAKLTGKSREEQQEAMKRHMVQGQVEAKFLMIRAKEGDAAEKVARAKYQEALTTASALGKQQEFMEGFLTGGGAITQAAGNMLSVSESSRQLAKLGGDIGKAGRDSVDATAASRNAMAAATKDMQNPAFLNMGIYGQALGDAGQQVIKSVEDQAVLNRAILKIQEDEFKASGKRLSTEEATAKALEDVKQAQMGFSKQADGTYKKVDGANQAMVQLNSAARTVASSLLTGMKPAIDQVQTGLGKLGNRLLTQDFTVKGPKGEVVKTNLAENIEKNVAAGVTGQTNPESVTPAKKDKYGMEVPKAGGTKYDTALKGLGEIVGGATSIADNVVKKLTSSGNSRDSGTLGKTGMMFEPSDFLGMVHKGETVLTPKQMENLVKGVQQSGMVEAVQNMTKSITPTAGGNIDLDKMMSGVNATISSVQKSAPNVENLLGDFMAGPMFGKKSSTATSTTETVTGGGSTLRQVVDTPAKIKLEKEQDALLEQYRLNRKAIADKIKQETGLKGKSLFEAMEASPEALALKAKFEKENDDYSRKILNERQAVTEILEEDAKLSKEKVKTVKKDLESNLTSSKKQTAAQEGKTAASLEELRLAVHDATAKKQKSADDRNYHGHVEYLANVKLNEAKKDFEKDKSEKNRQRVEEAQRTVDSTKKTAALVRAKDDENQQKLDNARKSFLDAKKKSTEIDKKTSTPKTTEAIKDNAPKNTILGTDGKVDLNAFSMGPNGLPIVNQLQAKAREIPDAVNPKETPEQADARKKAAPAAKAESVSNKSESKAGPGAGKTATLDDVVTRLDTLNSRIGQLIEQSSDIGQRQVRATKSNNQNLYAR